MVFDSLDGRRYLAEITTPNEAFGLFHEKGAETRLAELQRGGGRSRKL